MLGGKKDPARRIVKLYSCGNAAYTTQTAGTVAWNVLGPWQSHGIIFQDKITHIRTGILLTSFYYTTDTDRSIVITPQASGLSTSVLFPKASDVQIVQKFGWLDSDSPSRGVFIARLAHVIRFIAT